MDVILLERIERLGQMGDVVKVKNGFARNFLLPQKKALRATAANRADFEGQRVQLEARNLERKSEAETLAERVDGQSFVIIRQAGESGQLYGSVNTRDIATQVSEGGVSVTRNQVTLNTPIKTLGLHTVKVALHPEVSSEITINVARTDEEAERQARGEDVNAEIDDEDALAAEAVFEDEDDARQAEDDLENDAEVDDEEEPKERQWPLPSEATDETDGEGDDSANTESGDKA